MTSTRNSPEVLLRLLEISRQLSSEPDREEVLERIMDAAIEVTAAERGFLCLFEEGDLRIVVARNLDREEIKDAKAKLSHSIVQKVVATGEALVSLDAATDARLSDAASIHELKVRSVACIPLKVTPTRLDPKQTGVGGRLEERLIGLVYLDHRFQSAAFLDTEVELLEIFGAHAALAVKNAQLVSMLEEKNQQLNKELERSVHQLLETRSLLDDALATEPERHEIPGIVYASRAMHQLLGLVKRVADQDLPILIAGESGTGKELLARAIHELSGRRDGNFVAVNCGAIPTELFESEFFGHKRGAFTGAERDRMGLVESANRGTLFLDEISELPLQHQVKLLRTLQDGEVRRVGEDTARKVDFRVLAACNKDLQKEVQAGRFREDLFYRIRVFEVELPPLRNRAEDIPLLIDHFISQQAGSREIAIDANVYTILCNYRWPGNVRELQNELKRALALAVDNRIVSTGLSPHIVSAKPRTGAFAALREGRSLEEIVSVVEKEVIKETLERFNGNKSKTAQHLGISRNGLAMKMTRLGLA